MSAHELMTANALVSAQATEILRRRAASLAQAPDDAVSVESTGLLKFRLGQEWYAVPIAMVREIHNEYAITRIPRVPDYILGVVNVRGEIVSVTDLAALIRVPSRVALDIDDELPSAIIVANETCVSALVVDEIGDIIDVAREAIEPPLSTLDKAQAEYMSGSVFVDGLLIGVVNIEKILEPIGESHDGRAS
ncbi:MAG: purine-binding chemotaxis protein CheW [Coriobacteriia bacterium]|nr:purine-binding chemotaxis protein CheW [Coriobacteriia bacterium]MBN2840358.1 purine-binding chemotaxis protein CheW [Coriobacteriia bacterium]